MRRLSELTYADRFSATDEQVRFVTLSEQAARRGRVLVRTRLERDSGEPVTLDYVLTNTPGGPRIVNVLANGVSDLSLKRAEYAAVIRTEGVDGLERRLARTGGRPGRPGWRPGHRPRYRQLIPGVGGAIIPGISGAKPRRTLDAANVTRDRRWHGLCRPAAVGMCFHGGRHHRAPRPLRVLQPLHVRLQQGAR